MAVGGFALFILAILSPPIQAVLHSIKIGAIFHEGDERLLDAFNMALNDIDDEGMHVFRLQPITKENIPRDSFKASIAACELLAEGVSVIFGPGDPLTREVVSSIAARFDVPHIEYTFRRLEDYVIPSSSVNFYPNSRSLSQAIAQAVQAMNWPSFTTIYQSDDGLSRIQGALQLSRYDREHAINTPITVRQLMPLKKIRNLRPSEQNTVYLSLMKEIGKSQQSFILLDVESENINQVLSKAKDLKVITDYFQCLITNLDLTKQDISEVIGESSVNITTFKFMNDEAPFQTVEEALLYDSVFAFNSAIHYVYHEFKDDDSLDVEPVPLSCDDVQQYSAGSNITKTLLKKTKRGRTTGVMSFDEDGHRKFELELVGIQGDEVTKMGVWKNGELTITRSEQELSETISRAAEKKEFVVVVRKGAPYVIELDEGATRGVLIGEKRYEGYCIDLINKMAEILKIKTKFTLVPDNNYGSYDAVKGQWDGLIKELLNHKADLAICDLTITFDREKAVDFTMPFMNLGISILFTKPVTEEPSIFSFTLPFSTEVWMYMATAYLIVSLMLFFQARMAPGEWVNPHPCKSDPEELENNFTLTNATWLTMGSLMQQGCDILPRTPSIRMMAGMWWFFILIMISSYTANLASFLTSSRMETPINSAEDLAKQTKISYGSLKGGSTFSFFKNSNSSLYQRMFTTMSDTRPSVFTATNDEGVDRVLKGRRLYAFFMESTSIEYRIERNCELKQVGGLLDNKGYGIAMPPNSPYRTMISNAVLQLQENGELQQLKTKWWKHEGGGSCAEAEGEPSSSNELGMANVGGVFLVLLFGCAIAVFIGILEFLWNAKAVAIAEKITPWEAFKAELKFVVDIRATTKPVKVSKSTSGSSSSATGRFGRAASAARSIVGSFLKLDELGKFDKDATTNARNPERRGN